MSVFEALAKTGSEEGRNQNRAVITARVRAQDTFGTYLAKSRDQHEYSARLLAVEDSLRSVVAEVQDEYEVSFDSLWQPVLASLREANKYIKKRGDKWVIVQKGTGKVLSEHDSEEKADSSFKAMEMNKHGAGPEDRSGDSYQHERQDLPKADETGLADEGAVPTDKAKSGDEAGWNLEPIDVGSKRHELDKQDLLDRAEYNAEDFDPGNAVRERVNADTPMQPEFTNGPETDTWTGTEGQADPVTSQPFAAVSKYQVVDLG